MAGSVIKTFNCPNCGGGVQLRAMGRSLAVVCGSCFSVLDPNSPDHAILSKFTEKALKIQPLIPLGARGVLRGIPFECLGFMVRSDKSRMYSWDEYLLYNPQQGYRWVVVQNGHCSFVTPLKSPPVQRAADLSINPFQFREQSWQKYTDEPAVVRFVLGEFYWAVKVGETTRALDFIRPPLMLSFEVSDTEITASVGEYMPMSELAAAFKKDLADPPSPEGVSPHQPNLLSADSEKIVLLCIPFFLSILFMGKIYSFENAITFWILLFGYVFFYLGRVNSFEQNRWANSNFTPTKYMQKNGEGLANLLDAFDD